MSHKFQYFEVDVSQFLPPQWDLMVDEVLKKHRKLRINSDSAVADSSISREIKESADLNLYVVDGATITRELPWLYDLYSGVFRDMAQKNFQEQVIIAKEAARSMIMFEQEGVNMRLAAHVDPNPITGILYLTTQSQGEGGELVISNKEELGGQKILGLEEIESDSVTIYPVKGKLVFLDARKNPHFVKPLTRSDDKRIVVGMNYYTPSCTQEEMPF